MPPVADPKVDANIIEQVRSQVLDILHPHYDTPFNFLRWLQSYEFNVSKTVHNLRKHLKWRKERHLDEDARGLQSSAVCLYSVYTLFILCCVRSYLKKYFRLKVTAEYAPLSVVGWNRHEGGNYLVVVDQSGRIDIGGVMKSIQPTEYLHQLYRNFENFLEMIMEQEAKTGAQCSLLYVFDLDGLSFDPMLLGILSGPFRVSWQSLGTHYRELIGKFIVINTPSYINVLWSALSPFVPEQAKSRITITGRTWREDLLELAEVECLPERYGGKIPDEKVFRDPKPVPKDLYWRPKPDYPSVASMHRISTPAGKTRTMTYFAETGTELQIYTQNDSDFSFGIFYSEKEVRGITVYL
ncbi:CRAL/TRIO domain protein [Oesophagostomum dentatum]|uniref:CRAL/TRIO domain protein n=1 Tax=Oesophagostomum dentatum TaxID=61180 RepID=A0A0B1T094_OESDE|nr:CRAL/TRIO domain protein [Oesophagostomum dentatum]